METILIERDEIVNSKKDASIISELFSGSSSTSLCIVSCYCSVFNVLLLVLLFYQTNWHYIRRDRKISGFQKLA